MAKTVHGAPRLASYYENQAQVFLDAVTAERDRLWNLPTGETWDDPNQVVVEACVWGLNESIKHWTRVRDVWANSTDEHVKI